MHVKVDRRSVSFGCKTRQMCAQELVIVLILASSGQTDNWNQEENFPTIVRCETRVYKLLQHISFCNK